MSKSVDNGAATESESLQDLLLESSIDAYVLSLETINRISVRHRVQSFLFNLCNAWELLLKARIINLRGGDEAIYYGGQRNGPKLRTKALRDCLKEIYKENDPVRRNLWRVADLRDESIHLVMGEIPKDVLALLQACAINYHDALRKWFDRSLHDTMLLGMMTIVFDMSPERFDLKNAALRRRLDMEAIRYLQGLQDEIQREREELDNPQTFSIVFEYRLFLAKRDNDADVSLATGTDGKSLLPVHVPRDAASTHPYRQKELIAVIKRRTDGAFCPTTGDITAVKYAHNIETKPELFYQSAIPNSHKQYSDAFVNWLIDRHTADPNFLRMAREKYRKERLRRGKT